MRLQILAGIPNYNLVVTRKLYHQRVGSLSQDTRFQIKLCHSNQHILIDALQNPAGNAP